MWRIAGTTGAVGIEIAVAIIVGFLGGRYLDRKLGTTPWIGYLGIAAGVGAAIKALVRVVRNYRKDFPPDAEDTKDAKDSDTQNP
jgi:F0F1-type ATP synthase assembly protein I